MPVDPVDPVDPVEPVEPVEPVGPVGPWVPARDAISELPLGPKKMSFAATFPTTARSPQICVACVEPAYIRQPRVRTVPKLPALFSSAAKGPSEIATPNGSLCAGVVNCNETSCHAEEPVTLSRAVSTAPATWIEKTLAETRRTLTSSVHKELGYGLPTEAYSELDKAGKSMYCSGIPVALFV